MGQESFAGITVPAGDPWQLRDLAAGFNGAGGAVGQCASGLQALPPQLASWQGLASLSFDLLCTDRAGVAMTSASALSGAAQTASVFADALDAAQKQARAAIARAQDATRRISAAQAAQADAKQRAQTAAATAQQASQSLAISTLMAVPDPAAQQAQAQAQADGSAAQADGQRAQGALQAAQQELHDAQAQGKRAEQAAHQASQAAARSFYAIAGASPTPVAPGPPGAGQSGAGAPHKHDSSLLGDIWGTVKDGANSVVGFGGDALKGLGDFAGGLKDIGVLAYKLSPVYGVIDPNGQMQAQQQLLHGLEYGAQHPGEFAKALVDWKDITNGHPGRAFGQLLPNIVLAVASGGAGAAAKGADAANVLSKLGTTAKTTDALGATTRAADAANAASDASKASRFVPAGNAPPIRWNPVNGPGPLKPDVVQSFRSATYTEHTLSQPTTLYRVYSDPARKMGPYWSRTPPAGPLQSVMDSALNPQWGNTADHVVTVRVPPGVRVYEGVAGPQSWDTGSLLGGGNQVYIPHVEPSWEAVP